MAHLSLRVDDEWLAKVDALCEDFRLRRSWLLREALIVGVPQMQVAIERLPRGEVERRQFIGAMPKPQNARPASREERAAAATPDSPTDRPHRHRRELVEAGRGSVPARYRCADPACGIELT